MSSDKIEAMPKKPPSLRERQAKLTQDEILKAARRLFAERGYSRTSVRDIAEAAGVSAQTVYDSIGSKQAIVSRLNDLIDGEAGVADVVRRLAESSDPDEVVATSAVITRSILEHCGDVVHALVTGAAAEPALEAALAEGQRRHVEGARQVVKTSCQALDALDAIASAPRPPARRWRRDLRRPLRAWCSGEDYGWSLSTRHRDAGSPPPVIPEPAAASRGRQRPSWRRAQPGIVERSTVATSSGPVMPRRVASGAAARSSRRACCR